MKYSLLLLSLFLTTQMFAQKQEGSTTTVSSLKPQTENFLKKEAKPLERKPLTGQQRAEKAKENPVRSTKKEN